MPVNESAIKAAVKNAMEAAISETDPQNRDASIDKYAADLAKAITDAIRSGTVQSGIAVQVDPNTGTGATTGTGEIQ